MITAVDTNILIDLLGDDSGHSNRAEAWLSTARSRGSVIICPVVYGEIAPNFGSKSELDDALTSLSIVLSPITAEIAYEAGLRWRRYRQAGGPRTRILPDFLIGAHALVSADTFLTRDERFYRSYFPELQGA